MTDGPIMDAAADDSLAAHLKRPITKEHLDAMTESWGPEYVPANGWLPEQFPQMTVAPIPYTTFPHQRPDPFLTITAEGWLFIEIGNIRIALPDREEWDKLINMGERMWNTYEANQKIPDGPMPDPEGFFTREFTPPPAPPEFEFGEFQVGQNTPDEGDNDDSDPTD